MKEQSEDSYQHILKYTGLFGGVQGIIILIGLVRNKAMAVLLGAAGMGFNALMMSVQTFASRSTSRTTIHNWTTIFRSSACGV